MHAVEESFNCCGRNKGGGKTKGKNPLALTQNNLKRVDIFAYDEPAFRHERRQSTMRLEKRKIEIQRMKITNEKNLVDEK